MVKNLKTLLSINSTTLGVDILSSNLAALYDDTPYTYSSSRSTSLSLSSNQIVGIVLGIVIGLFVIAIIIPVFIWIRKSRSATAAAELEKDILNEKHEGKINLYDYNEPALL